MIGETVGEYKITAALGTGSVGETFSAEHATSAAKAMVEIVGPPIAGNADGIAKLVEDMTKLATIKQAGVLRVLEVGTDAGGRTFVVTAPIEGDSLATRIQATTRLSITQICEVGRQIANALAAIHDENVLHGELSPGCVYLLAAGGLSRGEPPKVTRAGVAGAKRAAGIKLDPTYTAPEVWSANSSEWRIDAYSLGCVVYEMATGKPPYVGKTPEEVRAKHLSAPTPSARALMPDVPPTLDVMLGRLLSKNPDDRYGSMREISRAFDALVAMAGKALAPTGGDMPALKLGDLAGAPETQVEGVTSGELKSRPAPPPEQTMRPDPVPVQPSPSPFPGASPGAGTTQQMAKVGKSSSALIVVVILVVVLVIGGVALALTM